MRRTIFDHTPDGLRQRLADMERQIADLQKVRNPPATYVEQADPITVESGTSGIADTSSTASVAHGLSGVPDTVLVTPRTAGEVLWVPDRDSSTFTVERAGTAGQLLFDWLAAGPQAPVSSTAYEELILSEPALVAAYPLALSSAANNTVVPDASGIGNDGSIKGTGLSVGVPSIIPVVSTTATTFNGPSTTTGDRVEVPGGSASLSTLSSITLEAWLQTSTKTAAQHIITRDTGTGGGRIWQFRIGTTGQLEWTMWNAAGTLKQSGAVGPDIANGAPHYVAVTYDAATGGYVAYVDGVAVGSGSTSGDLRNGTAAITIGNREVATWGRFGGPLQWCAIYNAALPPSAILLHYETGVGA